MFNLNKYVSAADLSTKVSPEDIPGRTIEEKAAYISEYLDREIGEKLAAGEINIEAAYKLLAETKVIGVPQQFEFLEKYRTNITSLIQSACTIKEQLEQTGLDQNQVSEIIIKKLLKNSHKTITRGGVILKVKKKKRIYNISFLSLNSIDPSLNFNLTVLLILTLIAIHMFC